MVDPRLVEAVDVLICRHARPGHLPLIAIAGAQGSGKSTLAADAARALSCATLSLDDVYRTRAQRAALAAGVHPLFAVRGPPGTHDLDLLATVLARLQATGPGDRTPLPAFDKLADDRRPETGWPVFHGRPRAILLEGWCLGATPQAPQALMAPINALERDHDSEGRWRTSVDMALGGAYADLFATFDALLFLKAPGFEPVLRWRLEQEAGLRGVAIETLPPGRAAEIHDFVQHFERITRSMLAGGLVADIVVELDEARRVRHIRSSGGA